MAQPVQYRWIDDALTFADYQTVTLNVPMHLNGQILKGVSRQVRAEEEAIDINKDRDFEIIGFDSFGKILPPEIITIPQDKADSPGSINLYSNIISVTPKTADINQPIKIIYDLDGVTQPFLCDVWNKEALYSFSITNTDINPTKLAVFPRYTLDPLPKWNPQGLSGQQPTYDPTWFDFPTSASTLTFTLTASTGGTITTYPTFFVTGEISPGIFTSEVVSNFNLSFTQTTAHSYLSAVSVRVQVAAVLTGPKTLTGNITVTSTNVSLSVSNTFATTVMGPVALLSTVPIPLLIQDNFSMKFPDYPITALQFFVPSFNDENQDDFTATIIQQGGYY